MSKIGISIKLDVKKLDKARFFAAQSGALYVDLTMFLDPDSEGQYGDHGFCTQSISKEERDGGVQMPIAGNGKIFYGLHELQRSTTGAEQQSQQRAQQQGCQQPAPQRAPQRPPQQQAYQQAPQQPQQAPQQSAGGFDDFDDDLPF